MNTLVKSYDHFLISAREKGGVGGQGYRENWWEAGFWLLGVNLLAGLDRRWECCSRNAVLACKFPTAPESNRQPSS